MSDLLLDLSRIGLLVWTDTYLCLDKISVAPRLKAVYLMYILCMLLSHYAVKWIIFSYSQNLQHFIFSWLRYWISWFFFCKGHGQATKDSFPTKFCSLSWWFSYDDDCKFLQKGGLELCRFFWSFLLLFLFCF